MRKKEERKWSGKSRGGRWGYLFFVYTIKLLGVRVAYGFLAFIAIHFIPFAPRATQAVWSYNRKQLHYGVWQSCWKLYLHYYRFGQTLIDKIAIKSGLVHRYKFKFDHYDRFLEIMNQNRGVVMIGAHVGCWEAGAGFFGKYGRKMNIVMFDAEHQQIKEVLEQASDEQNFKIIPVNHDSLEAILNIKVALNNGEYVCFNGDRYLDEASSVPVNFLDGEAKFPVGPFKIASRCRVPVVFYYAMREPGCTYRFIFEETASGNGLNAESLLSQYVSSLEAVVKKYPQQWFNFYRFWNNRN